MICILRIRTLNCLYWEKYNTENDYFYVTMSSGVLYLVAKSLFIPVFSHFSIRNHCCFLPFLLSYSFLIFFKAISGFLYSLCDAFQLPSLSLLHSFLSFALSARASARSRSLLWNVQNIRLAPYSNVQNAKRQFARWLCWMVFRSSWNSFETVLSPFSAPLTHEA